VIACSLRFIRKHHEMDCLRITHKHNGMNNWAPIQEKHLIETICFMLKSVT
jgi:hypothetical protein